MARQGSFEHHTRAWAAEPGMDDATLRERTGRDWEEWCDVIEET